MSSEKVPSVYLGEVCEVVGLGHHFDSEVGAVIRAQGVTEDLQITRAHVNSKHM